MSTEPTQTERQRILGDLADAREVYEQTLAVAQQGLAAAVAAAYQEGLAQTDIATALDISPNTVRRMLAELGVETRRPGRR
jgi:DNA-directed RNA polymerase specialized sigma24 family protein